MLVVNMASCVYQYLFIPSGLQIQSDPHTNKSKLMINNNKLDRSGPEDDG